MSAKGEVTVLLSVGSNIGDREANLRFAEEQLASCEAVADLKVSSIYETDPVGYTDQPDFLNECVLFKTNLGPYELLELTSSIENDCGRTREIHWGPRTLDVDIIIYGDLVQDDPKLTLPHPRWKERSFVKIPAAELMDIGDVAKDEGVRLYKQRI